jgi:hypothetical protein
MSLLIYWRLVTIKFQAVKVVILLEAVDLIMPIITLEHKEGILKSWIMGKTKKELTWSKISRYHHPRRTIFSNAWRKYHLMVVMSRITKIKI